MGNVLKSTIDTGLNRRCRQADWAKARQQQALPLPLGTSGSRWNGFPSSVRPGSLPAWLAPDRQLDSFAVLRFGCGAVGLGYG